DIDLAALGAPLPAILGHEMTGRVVRLGRGITTDSAGQPLKEGDRVVYQYFVPCGRCPACLRGDHAACPANLMYMMPSDPPPHFFGAYADYYYLRPTQTVIKVPDNLSDALVAPVNCALSEVIYGLEKIGLGFGETIVIQGAGGLGINATAVAREMGAHKVIVIDGIADRLSLARAFGADEVIDMKEYKTPDARIGRVLELTGFRGADVVAEFVGTPAAIPEGLAMLGSGGRYLEIGNISMGKTCQIDPALLVMGSKNIRAIVAYGRDTLKKALDFLSRTQGKYPFDKILARSYPLEEIEAAFENQDKGLVQRSAIVP
ncbi:MAG: zinc-binding dehydrogenase, partial [Chloroflexi bacterium]|nr:zinc-binding dehydrogenase [Chloroflexota bacterium]